MSASIPGSCDAQAVALSWVGLGSVDGGGRFGSAGVARLRVAHRLTEQHAVGDELDARLAGASVLKAHREAHIASQLRAALLRHPASGGDCCDAAGLRDADRAEALLRQYLRQLCGLATSRVAEHDDHWTRTELVQDLLSVRVDRQRRSARHAPASEGCNHGPKMVYLFLEQGTLSHAARAPVRVR